MVIIAKQAPPKSRYKMDALAGLPEIETQMFPGTWGLQEESVAELAEVVASFLAR